MSDPARRIAENLSRVREQIAAAAARCGRKAEEITLVGVTKYVSADVARLLATSGCRDLGESRPQELWNKAALLADLPVRWHMIGHVQRNKVRRTLPSLALLHSLDSRRLLETIDAEAEAAGIESVAALLEVNVSGEASKGGLRPDEVEPLLAELPRWPRVAVKGLMCMAALEGGPDAAQRDFAALGQLRDSLRPRCPPGVALDELSMGMSGDFPQAIAEGATIVRIGSALFEGVE
jgi:pyridoxal phosphate enzyme (YggS family)